MTTERQQMLIVGSLAFDSVETPSGSVERALGGSASFASIAASYYAAPGVVGVVGEDFEDHHIARLSEHGVDVEGVERVDGRTFHWRGRYHERVDLLFINDEEASLLTGEWTVLAAAEKIMAMGPRYVVIKRGEYGAVLFGPDTTLFVPAVLLSDVVDPTGAGDTFAGGFLGYLSRQPAIDRGSLAGALVASSEAIDARRAQLERMIRI
jgi:sugar/nucleoside kinase (ribokinase family)